MSYERRPRTDGVGLEAHIWLDHRVYLKIWNICFLFVFAGWSSDLVGMHPSIHLLLTTNYSESGSLEALGTGVRPSSPLCTSTHQVIHPLINPHI